MAHVLVIGGGLAGCAAALELANGGFFVTIVEKSDALGGKVRNYGCKATDKCNKCGLCIKGDLWRSVEGSRNIEIITCSRVKDILGSKGSFEAFVCRNNNVETLKGITSIIVSTGFDDFSEHTWGDLEINTTAGVISGHELERLLYERKRDGIFANAPESIAFIQCFGSRNVRQKADYCSRVCCGYSTRSARVLRQYYPKARIVFFYMDLQQVEHDYKEILSAENIELIRCRPVRINGKERARVAYEKPGANGLIEEDFDIIVLSEGIRPSSDNSGIAEICMLGVGRDGFLKYVKKGSETGVFLAGCAAGPRSIEESYSEAVAVAREILASSGSSLKA